MKPEDIKKTVEALKKEHKAVNVITVDMDGKTYVGFFKRPGRDVMARAMSMESQHLKVEAGEFILDNCWIKGDEEMKTDEDLRLSASFHASNTMVMLQGKMQMY